MRKIMNEEKIRCQLCVDYMILQIFRMKQNVEFFFVNHEYKNNNGTLYKGSIKESKDFLRFKERFKSKMLVATWDAKKYIWEAI